MEQNTIQYDKRWINGYCESNRPKYENGLDINLWTWRRKNIGDHLYKLYLQVGGLLVV